MKHSLLTALDVLYVDHIAVTTPVFDQTLHDYLGLAGSRLEKGPALNPVQKVVYAFVRLRDGIVVEVLGVEKDSPIARHVRQGGGPYHFCYAVENLDASVAKAESAGAKLLVKAIADVAFDGRRVAFLFHESQGVFELVEALPPASAPGGAPLWKEARPAGAETRHPAVATEPALEDRLKSLFLRIFPLLDPGSVGSDAINQTQGWDSLAHIRLMMEVETEFGINIPAEEIGGLTNYELILHRVKREAQ